MHELQPSVWKYKVRQITVIPGLMNAKDRVAVQYRAN